nr:hypothetical protein GCM10020241_24820 [Streptoalloteichus tenebrarius]
MPPVPTTPRPPGQVDGDAERVGDVAEVGRADDLLDPRRPDVTVQATINSTCAHRRAHQLAPAGGQAGVKPGDVREAAFDALDPHRLAAVRGWHEARLVRRQGQTRGPSWPRSSDLTTYPRAGRTEKRYRPA